MKNIFRIVRLSVLVRGCEFLFILFCLLNNANPLLAQWVASTGLTSPYARAFAISDTNLFVGTDGAGVFSSMDNGASWTPTGMTNTSVSALAISDTNLFAGVFGGGVFRSSNNGASWAAANSGLTDTVVIALAVNGTNLYAGIYGGGVFLSTNNGISWNAVNTGLTSLYVRCLTISPDSVGGEKIFAGTVGGGVFVSTNNGTSWKAVNTGLTKTVILSLAFSGTKLFAGIGGADSAGVFVSTNDGTSWNESSIGLIYSDVFAFAVSPQSGDVGTVLFAGTREKGVFISTNNGISWNTVNTGFPMTDVNTLTIFGTNLFAGTYNGVWRRPLSEMITSVNNPSTEIPSIFILEQNYPNPFNPSTTISFSLPSQSFVSLKIFDLIGREQAIIISEELSAGYYSQQWSADGLPSGIYFYQIQSGTNVETKKLVLLK